MYGDKELEDVLHLQTQTRSMSGLEQTECKMHEKIISHLKSEKLG